MSTTPGVVVAGSLLIDLQAAYYDAAAHVWDNRVTFGARQFDIRSCSNKDEKNIDVVILAVERDV